MSLSLPCGSASFSFSTGAMLGMHCLLIDGPSLRPVAVSTSVTSTSTRFQQASTAQVTVLCELVHLLYP